MKISGAFCVACTLLANEALGLDLFVAATANPNSDSLEQTDYGDPLQAGGRVVAAGAYLPGDSAWPVPFELRFQNVSLRAAWNDNKPPGDTQYRDGYEIEADEILLGHRWSLGPRLDASALIGGGHTQIRYKTRENQHDGATRGGDSGARHVTQQLDFRYGLPVPLPEPRRLAVAITGMVRLSVLEKHRGYDEVTPVVWYLNVPYLPLPSVGLTFGLTL